MVILTLSHWLGSAVKTEGVKLTQSKKSSPCSFSERATSLFWLTENLYRLTLSFSGSEELFLTLSSAETALPGVVVRLMGKGDVMRLKGCWACNFRGDNKLSAKP